VARQRVEHLVGFLDEERAQGLERLLAVPRAAAGSQQSVHDFDESAERRSRLHTPCYTAVSDVAKQLTREKLAFDDPEALQALCGSNNSRLKLIERTAGAEVHLRGNEITIEGEEAAAETARSALEQ